MASIPDLLANPEANPDDEHWLDLASVVMRGLAERYRPNAQGVDCGTYERDLDSLDRLADLIRAYNRRLKELLPPAG